MDKMNKTVPLLRERFISGGVRHLEAQVKPAGLYLMELRSRHVRPFSGPGRKLVIPVAFDKGVKRTPEVIKITHR